MPIPLEIHQFVPSLAIYDAVGQHSLALQTFLRSLGAESEIYADEIKPGAERYAKHYSMFRPSPSDRRYLIYQASTASPIAEYLTHRPEVKLVNFHNITPPSLVASWDLGISMAMSRAYAEVERFAKSTALAFTVSHYNMGELERMRYEKIALASPFIALAERWTRTPKLVNEGARWLFVGRVFPNKGQLELVRAFALYRQVFDSSATLTLVGSKSCGSYVNAIEQLIDTLELGNAVKLIGQVTDAELSELYRTSDVFTCMSVHEGFCFPVIESMRNDLPVVALGRAAVPETVGDGGVIVEGDDPLEFCAAVSAVLESVELQAELSRRGRGQLERYGIDRARLEHRNALAQVIDLPELQPEMDQ